MNQKPSVSVPEYGLQFSTGSLPKFANGAVVVGRNMDFHMDLRTNLWKLPRGVKRDDRVEGKLSWTAKYGSVIAGVFDILSTDGMNENGLAGHILWLAESEYGVPDDSRPQLAMSVWLQYYLDNFATVAEAVDWTQENDPQIIPMADPTGGSQPALHLALDDAAGDSAIFEYLDGTLNIYCLLYTSPSPRDRTRTRLPSSA